MRIWGEFANLPLINIFPPVGVVKPQRMRKNVVFPQPEGPLKETNSCWLTAKETFSKIISLPFVFAKFSILMVGLLVIFFVDAKKEIYCKNRKKADEKQGQSHSAHQFLCAVVEYDKKPRDNRLKSGGLDEQGEGKFRCNKPKTKHPG